MSEEVTYNVALKVKDIENFKQMGQKNPQNTSPRILKEENKKWERNNIRQFQD